jgi:Histidine kinase-, DNA gyrase B-, and HSP90-like ATPase.
MKKIIFRNSVLFLGTIALLFLFSTVDQDITITSSALASICFFILLLFVAISSYEIWTFNQNMQQECLLVEKILRDEYVEITNNEQKLLQTLVRRNVEQKNLLLQIEQQQVSWIHDIKLPLATLQLFIENQKSELSAENKKTLELVSLNFDQLIENKLMLDKVTLAVDDLIIEKVAIKPIIINVVKKLSHLFHLKDIQIELDCDDYIVTSDSKSLRYCFEQIIANSLKYTENSGKIQILVKPNHISGKTQLQCIDNGCGIDNQDLPQIFNYGYTGKNGIIPVKNASSGVGLYMVKQILDKLNHKITVNSKINEGTTMIIEF